MTEALIGLSVFTLLGTVAVVVGVSKLRNWKQITGTDRETIRDASVMDGVVEIEGTVEPVTEDVLQAPMSGRDSVVFEYELRRKKGSGVPTIVDEGEETQPFMIDDGTATAYVDSDRGELSLSHESISDATLGELPEYIFTNPTLSGARHFREGRIEPGDTAYVIGSTVASPNGEADTEMTNDTGSLLISNQSADATATRLFRRGALIFSIGVVITIVGGFILLTRLGIL